MSLVLIDKPASTALLEANSERRVGEISTVMCETLAQNLTFRMEHLKRSRGLHLQ